MVEIRIKSSTSLAIIGRLGNVSMRVWECKKPPDGSKIHRTLKTGEQCGLLA